MTDVEAHRLRENFFAELDVAMTELPYRVATDIRQGIAEEIDGLDARDTAQRLALLGAPEAIAREAAASLGAPPATHRDLTQPTGIDRSRGFAIAAALVLAGGGVVVPVLGFFVGIVMVGMSGLWHRWEKLLAILLPFAIVAGIGAVTWLVAIAQPPSAITGEVSNPLLPASYDTWYSTLLFGLMLIPICGLWLLWRLRGRATGR